VAASRRSGAGSQGVRAVARREHRPDPVEPTATEHRLLKELAEARELDGRLCQLERQLGRLEMQLSGLVRNLLVPEQLVDPPRRLVGGRFALHSQFEEDGITLALHQAIGPVTRRFVELGCGSNGGNSGVLAAELGWAGLMVDHDATSAATAAALNPSLVRGVAHWVTVESVDDLLRREGFEGPIDHLGIDLDGNDYWIWAGLDAVDPRVVIVEFNSSFGPERRVTVPYNPEFRRATQRGVQRLYFGASLQALVDLGIERGYRLVAVEPHGANAFFVKEELAPMLPTCDPIEAFRSYERHRPYMRRGDIVAQLKAAGLALVKTSPSGRVAARPALERPPTRDEVFASIGEHAPLVGVSTGAGRFVVSTRDRTVARILFVKQSRSEMVALRRALDVLDVLDVQDRHERRLLLDVGANIGTTTVAALTNQGFERAIAFEPEPENVRLLTANIALNGLADRVTVRPVAVSDVEGPLSFLLHPFSFGGHEVPRDVGRPFEGELHDDVEIEKIEVPGVTLDHDLQRLGVDGQEVGLLWLDVQGHETSVLRGAHHLLAGGVPLVTEFYPQMLRDAGTLDAFVDAVTPYFQHYVELRAPACAEPVAITALRAAADGFGEAGRPAFTDLLLLP
jgi:FkbM family methyltransferase